MREKCVKSLTKTESVVLEYVAARMAVSSTDVAGHMGMSVGGARKVLQRLIGKGLVVSEGQGKSTRYLLASDGDDEA